jgi:hypothetical protein
MPKKNFSDPQLQQAYQKACTDHLGSADVKAIDVGYKYVDGKRTDDIVIRFHTKKKISEDKLDPAKLFPKEIYGVPIDVIEVTYKLPTDEPTAANEPSELPSEPRKIRQNIIQPGLSISHSEKNYGTFGAVVYNSSGCACILSNWHVLVSSSNASSEGAIIQPGFADGGKYPQDRVGKLEGERFIINEKGDAAIAVLDQPLGRSLNRAQFDTRVIIESARMAKVGDILKKSGRTTGITKGKVDGVGSYKIKYGEPVGEKIIEGFKIVPVIDGNPDEEEISHSGDSGSIWYDPKTKEGVGLHFAGNPNSEPKKEHALACHLPIVLEELQVSLVPPADERKASK